MIEFLSPEETQLEIARTTPVDEFVAGSTQHIYGRLESDDFERLLYTIFEHRRSTQNEYDLVSLMVAGADRGRDIWLTKAGRPAGLVQCKRSAGLTLPSVLQEVIKFLLFGEIDPRIAPPEGFLYSLATSGDPAGTTVDFFASPAVGLHQNRASIEPHLEAVIGKYASFTGMKAAKLSGPITAQLERLRYALIRPADLDAILHDAPQISSRFFRVQPMIDIAGARTMIESVLGERVAAEASAGVNPATPRPVPTFGLRFREKEGFEDTDEELGLRAAEFITQHRRDPAATISVEIVDDFGVAEKLAALTGMISPSAAERELRLNLAAIDLRYRDVERDLSAQLMFMLTSEEVGRIWFGGRDFETQGRAIRALGNLFQDWEARDTQGLGLAAFPNPLQNHIVVKFLLDADETKSFYASNDITDARVQLSPYWGHTVLDLEPAVRVGKYAPALVNRLHKIAKAEGKTISAVLEGVKEPVFAWPIGLA